MSAKKPVAATKPQKRKYVTTHELQQKQKQKKITKKSPEVGKMQVQNTEQATSVVKTRGSVRRKLNLQHNTSGGECDVENDSSTEVFLTCQSSLIFKNRKDSIN